jgi:type III secretion protein HrpB1
MNEFLNRTQFVRALIEVLNTGLTHYLDDDAEILLSAVRVLRPDFKELLTFDGLLAIHRGKWEDGIRALADLDTAAPKWMMGKALLAVCKYGMDDPSWTIPAHEVLAQDGNGVAAEFVRAMVGDHLPGAASAASTSTAPAPWVPSSDDPRTAQYAGFGVM